MRFSTESIMSTDLITISENKTISEAENIMKSCSIRHLPVIGDDNELTGVISVTDTARTHNKTSKIKSVMNTHVRIIKSDANIKKVIEQMLMFKISSMLVARQNELVGILTTDDLIQLLYNLIDEGENLIKLDIASFIDEDWDKANDEEEQIREVTNNLEKLG